MWKTHTQTRKNFLKEDSEDNYDSYDISNINSFKLTILAPKEYYDIFNSDKNIFKKYNEICDTFKNFIEKDLSKKLKRNIEIEFSTKYFCFTRSEFDKLIGKNDEPEYKDSIILTFLKSKNISLRPKTEKKSIINVTNTGEIDINNYLKSHVEKYKNNFINWYDFKIL